MVCGVNDGAHGWTRARTLQPAPTRLPAAAPLSLSPHPALCLLTPARSPQLEAHLVVALAGGAVGHGVGAHLRTHRCSTRFSPSAAAHAPRHARAAHCSTALRSSRAARPSASAPSTRRTSLAISIWRLARSGRAMEVPSRYTPSYVELALRYRRYRAAAAGSCQAGTRIGTQQAVAGSPRATPETAGTGPHRNMGKTKSRTNSSRRSSM